MRSALDSESCSVVTKNENIQNGAYTWTLRSSMFVVGSCAQRSEDKATQVAVQKATVVKKPNTFCTRLIAECMPTHRLLNGAAGLAFKMMLRRCSQIIY